MRYGSISNTGIENVKTIDEKLIIFLNSIETAPSEIQKAADDFLQTIDKLKKNYVSNIVKLKVGERRQSDSERYLLLCQQECICFRKRDPYLNQISPDEAFEVEEQVEKAKLELSFRISELRIIERKLELSKEKLCRLSRKAEHLFQSTLEKYPDQAWLRIYKTCSSEEKSEPTHKNEVNGNSANHYANLRYPPIELPKSRDPFKRKQRTYTVNPDNQFPANGKLSSGAPCSPRMTRAVTIHTTAPNSPPILKKISKSNGNVPNSPPIQRRRSKNATSEPNSPRMPRRPINKQTSCESPCIDRRPMTKQTSYESYYSPQVIRRPLRSSNGVPLSPEIIRRPAGGAINICNGYSKQTPSQDLASSCDILPPSKPIYNARRRGSESAVSSNRTNTINNLPPSDTARIIDKTAADNVADVIEMIDDSKNVSVQSTESVIKAKTTTSDVISTPCAVAKRNKSDPSNVRYVAENRVKKHLGDNSENRFIKTTADDAKDGISMSKREIPLAPDAVTTLNDQSDGWHSDEPKSHLYEEVSVYSKCKQKNKKKNKLQFLTKMFHGPWEGWDDDM